MLHNPAVQVLKSKSALALKYEQQVLLENYLVAQLDTKYKSLVFSFGFL